MFSSTISLQYGAARGLSLPLTLQRTAGTPELTPLWKNFEKEEYGRSSSLKRMGRGAPSVAPSRLVNYPHTPLLPNFFENYNPVRKNFFEKPIYTLIYHRLAHAKFETLVGFEASKSNLPARSKVIKRACFPSLTTVESRLERLYQSLSVERPALTSEIGGTHLCPSSCRWNTWGIFGGVHRVGTVEHHGPTAVPAISNNCREEAVDGHNTKQGKVSMRERYKN